LGQVEKDDIPMQREACHEFAKQKSWVIAQEFFEKGISGYKVSSDDREALQKIRKAAIQKTFDVLLVFMFDRLGRRDDETPFVVEWFVKHGIEVWSVIEGEQRFENHIDKLLNYLRYWQSSGESLKTSVRTKTRMEQLVKEGFFVGGTPPYGYKLCKVGRINKHGFEVHDIFIDQYESDVVKMIYSLYCKGKMGTYRIAQHLTHKSILTRKGLPWNSGSISHILKNPVYTGIRKFGDVSSDVLSHLQVIDIDTYKLAQVQIEKNKLIKPRGPRSEHASSVLFADVLYCIHCKKRMTVTRNRKIQHNEDGSQSVYDRVNYICINKSSVNRCGGQRSYSAKIVDRLFSEKINKFLNKDNIHQTFESNITHNANENTELLEHALIREKNTLDLLQKEAVEVILGTSAFMPILITDLSQHSKNNIVHLENEIFTQRELKRTQEAKKNRLYDVYKQFEAKKYMSFTSLSLLMQQEIIEQIIERIYIGRGYQFKLEWTFGEYFEGRDDNA